ncbi:MAG TPA: aldehyde dehydrogenase family protein [Solirubrobacteraceae bacterium]|nr:aldehyde dehydrogenase family protein [Solirubrobacteraceae bacterium]
MSSITVPHMTIAGAAARAEEIYNVADPATGETFAEAPACSTRQLDQAFSAALDAQPAWEADENGRRALMLEVADAIVAAGDELGRWLIRETGKPSWLPPIEIDAAEGWLRYYAATEIPRTLVSEDETARVELRHRAAGVAAGIIPWNFPVGSAIWKIAPAMRTGCAIVLKPSPFAPLAVLRLGEILAEHLPPGVVSVVSGDDALGAAMASHPVPRKISFTGSIAAGKQVALAGAPDLKRLTLELGGNDAALLLPDVELNAAVPALLATATFNTGQVCAIPKRVYVPEPLYDDAVEAFAEGARAISLGAGDDGQMGPLSTKPQFDRVSALVAEALRGGARAAAGGVAGEGPGYFFPATVLAGVADADRIVVEERFGPVIPILPYRDLDDAITRANGTMYGLCGSVWSADPERAAAVAERLECGVAYVNAHATLPPQMPFLGTKWSGVGVENGIDGLLDFTERQVVYTAS